LDRLIAPPVFLLNQQKIGFHGSERTLALAIMARKNMASAPFALPDSSQKLSSFQAGLAS